MAEDDQASKAKVNWNWFSTTEVMKIVFEVLWHRLEGMNPILVENMHL